MNLCMSLIFMSKLKTKVNGIMKICKRVLSADLDKRGNITHRRGPKPHWADCFIIAISLLAKFEGIDSKSRLIAILQKHKREFHHLISRLHIMTVGEHYCPIVQNCNDLWLIK